MEVEAARKAASELGLRLWPADAMRDMALHRDCLTVVVENARITRAVGLG